MGGQFSTDSMAWVQIESQIVEILSWTHFSCWVQVREQHGSSVVQDFRVLSQFTVKLRRQSNLLAGRGVFLAD